MKNKIGFIGIGQFGGNIVSRFEKLGYNCMAINSSEKDLSTVDVKEKYHFSNSEGCNHDREKSKNYLKKHYNEIIERVEEQFKNTKIIYIVYSAGGGTGSGSGPILTKALAIKFSNKRVGVIVALPSIHEVARAQVNAYHCITEITEIEEVASVFILDNNKEDIFSINDKFIEYFEDMVNMPKHISDKGNIDNSELIETLSARGMCKVIKSSKIGGLSKVNENVFTDIEEDKKLVYMAMTLNKETEIDEIYREIGIPYDIFINYNSSIDNIMVISGLSFPKTRIDNIKNIATNIKDTVVKSVENSQNSVVKNELDWGVEIRKSKDKQHKDKVEIDINELFRDRVRD